MVAAAYFGSAEVGLSLATTHKSVSPVWPPAGLAIAALLLIGYRAWPGVLLGAFAARFWINGDAPLAAAIASGSALEALLAVCIINQIAGGRRVFERVSDIARYVLIALPLAVSVGATVTTLAVAGTAAPGAVDLREIWLTWWLGDLVGALTVAPFLVIWLGRPMERLGLRGSLEAVILLLTTTVIAGIVFGGVLPTPYQRYPIAFIAIPTLVWAGFRFGLRGAISVTMITSVLAIWGTLRGYGPFDSENLNEALLLAQAFIGVVTVTTLVIAALVLQREQAEVANLHSANRLEIALAAGNMGAWEWDIAVNRVGWSAALEAICGLPWGTFGGTWDEFLRTIHPEDRDGVIDAIRRAVRERTPYRREYRVIRPDNSVAWLEARGQVFRTPQGEPIRMAGVCMDITGRKQAERRLTAEHTITRVLSESPSLDHAAPDIIRAFCEAVDGALGELWVPNSSGTQLECRAIWTPPDFSGMEAFLEMSREIAFAPGEGLPGRVWESRKPAIITDLWMDDNFLRRDAARLSGLRSGHAFPIVTGDEFLGVIEFFTNHRLEANEALQHMMTAIGREVGQFMQRHRAEEALRQSEARQRARAAELAAIMDAVPAVVWIAHDPECRRITGNRAAYEFLKLAPGMNHSKSAPEDERPTNFKIMRDGREVPAHELPMQMAARLGEPVIGAELEIVFDDGTVQHEFGNATPLFDEAGRVRGCAAAFVDVTALKRALRERHEGQELYQAIIQSALDAIISMDQNGRVIEWNSAAEKIFGHSHDEAIGQPLVNLIVPARMRQGHSEGLQRYLKTRKHRVLDRRIEMPALRCDGTEIQVELAITALERDSGTIFTAHARDVSERIRSEQAQRLLATIVTSSDDAIVSNAPDGTIITWNRGAERMFGYSADEVIGKPLTILIPRQRRSEEDQIMRRLLAGEQIEPYETVALTKDRRAMDVSVVMSPIRNSGGVIIAASKIARDITERKKMEHELEHHRERLEHLVEQRTAALEASQQQLRISERMAAMGTLSTGIGHDMGNLLLPMRSRLEVLKSLDLAPDAKEHVRAIELCIDHLYTLVRGLRLMAQDPEQHDPDARTDLSQWATETVPLYAGIVHDSARVTAEIPADLPPVAIASHVLTQAVRNLVKNARDAIGLDRAGRVVIRAVRNRDDETVSVAVIDDGTGMSHSVKARALEPFFTTKTRSLSTGLGLSTAHGMVHSVGGQVEIYSPPPPEFALPPSSKSVGRGSAVVLVLPMSSKVDTRPLERRVASISVGDLRARGVLASVLQSMGIHAEVCSNGAPCAAGDLELWFTDAVPDRINAVREFLAAGPHRKVIVVAEAPEPWQQIGARVIDPSCKPSAIRAAVES